MTNDRFQKTRIATRFETGKNLAPGKSSHFFTNFRRRHGKGDGLCGTNNPRNSKTGLTYCQRQTNQLDQHERKRKKRGGKCTPPLSVTYLVRPKINRGNQLILETDLAAVVF